jgi:nucleoid-associated protein YgaU
VLERCGEYLPGVEPYPAIEAREVPTRHFIGVKDVLASFDLDPDRFRDLNPALLPLVMSGDRRIPAGYRMRIPADVAPDPDAAYAMIPESALHARQVPLQTYTVRRGDSLSTIARRFGTNARELSRINGLTGTLIRPGQVLRLPPRR